MVEQDPREQALKAAIQEGIESGVSDKTVPDIIKDVGTRLRADGCLLIDPEDGRRLEKEKDGDSKD